MFSRSVFVLALLSVSVMGDYIQNRGSREFLTDHATLDPDGGAVWHAICQPVTPTRCQFHTHNDDGTKTYLVEGPDGYVDTDAWAVTPWIRTGEPGHEQIKNWEGKCWTQFKDGGVLIALEDCVDGNRYQLWHIPEQSN